jgi:hypothetical protein
MGHVGGHHVTLCWQMLASGVSEGGSDIGLARGAVCKMNVRCVSGLALRPREAVHALGIAL